MPESGEGGLQREGIGMSRRLAVLVMTAGWWLSVSPGLRGGVHTSTDAPGRTHTYYIAADEVGWNYAPANTWTT
jgi:hypothetical protein